MMNINNINNINFTSYYLKGEKLDRLAILTRDMEYTKAIKDKKPKESKDKKEDKDQSVIVYGEVVEIDPLLYEQDMFQNTYKMQVSKDKKPTPVEVSESLDKIKRQTPPVKRIKLDIKA